MTQSVYLADLTWTQAKDLLQSSRKLVLILPLGAVEAHGPHGPLEADTVISLGMCERAARALADDPAVGALLLPPITYGVTRYGAAFPGTIGIRQETLAELILDVCRAAIENGFSRIAVVNNHFEPEQVETIRRVVADVGAAPGVKTAYLDLTRRANAERLGGEFSSGSCHAGRYETSLVLAERPELIDTVVMSRLQPLFVDMPQAIVAGRTDFLAMGMSDAYCGSPSEATAGEGEERFATLTQMLVDLIRDLAEE